MEEMEPVTGVKKVSPAIILAVVAIVVVALIVYASNKASGSAALNNQNVPVDENGVPLNINDDSGSYTDPGAVTDPSTAPAPTPAPATTQSATFKNGTYSAEGDYSAPSGAEHINVTLTLKNGVVTASTVTDGAAMSPISQKMQADFIANYKTMVIGQKIANLNLGKVSGSSLTPIGFNDAVAKIAAEAQA